MQRFSHPSTNQARPCLASKIRRDWACSVMQRFYLSSIYLAICLLYVLYVSSQKYKYVSLQSTIVFLFIQLSKMCQACQLFQLISTVRRTVWNCVGVASSIHFLNSGFKILQWIVFNCIKIYYISGICIILLNLIYTYHYVIAII